MIDVTRQLDHFVCNAPARALLTSPRVDRQTAVADHFVIRTSIRAEAQGQPPAPRAPNHIPPSLSRSNRSNCHIQLLGCAKQTLQQTTLTQTQDIHQLTSQFLEISQCSRDNLRSSTLTTGH
ncbi:hypothetical protein BASA81_011989 [Batrachochytrium salamandrivorans]|nr:hypothetical protein BASA81_011989 [Batrachochytrium salamandrivorans]